MNKNSIDSNAKELIAQKKVEIEKCDEWINKLSGDIFLQYGHIRRKEELQKEIEAIELIDDSIIKAFDKFDTDVQNTIKKSSPK